LTNPVILEMQYLKYSVFEGCVQKLTAKLKIYSIRIVLALDNKFWNTASIDNFILIIKYKVI